MLKRESRSPYSRLTVQVLEVTDVLRRGGHCVPDRLVLLHWWVVTGLRIPVAIHSHKTFAHRTRYTSVSSQSLSLSSAREDAPPRKWPYLSESPSGVSSSFLVPGRDRPGVLLLSLPLS